MNESRDSRLADQIHAIAAELSKLAIACDIKMFEPGVAERILKDDDGVCGRNNPQAFQQMRKHLMVLFPLRKKAVDELGAAETKRVMEQVRAAITALRESNRVGNKDQ
jgi:hypothetical protein